ncbi:MAG TPA: hypothetical protein VIJ31_10540, partial [Acidothermaceae bacterium]
KAGRMPDESHTTKVVDSRDENDPTNHLDRALPGTGRTSIQQVAAMTHFRGAGMPVRGACVGSAGEVG